MRDSKDEFLVDVTQGGEGLDVAAQLALLVHCRTKTLIHSGCGIEANYISI